MNTPQYHAASTKQSKTKPVVLITNIYNNVYIYGLTVIPVWISNYIHCKVWDEITYPFLNFNGCNHRSLGMDKLFHLTLYQACNYLSMHGLKLNHVSKRGPRCIVYGMYCRCVLAILFQCFETQAINICYWLLTALHLIWLWNVLFFGLLSNSFL